MSELSAWSIGVSEIPAAGKRIEYTATEAERIAAARAWDILACTALACEIRVKPLRDGRYRVAGTIRASIVQACVVTLEPVDGTIEEAFDVEFWPADQIPSLQSTAQDEWFDPQAADGAEPIENGRIGLGRLVFECVSAALDPYPRKPGATLDWQEPETSKAAVHPFAALAKLKPKQ